MASTSNEEDKLITTADKYFIEQRNIVLQEIDETMSSILNGLNVLNISLESSIAVGREFQSVSDLWKTFYDGLESIPDEVPIDEQTTLSQAKPTTK
ncbi:DAD1-like protein [Saccharomyces kudriavzevii IFO 1802]|nr:DAD1-like protein [Saccharomyces kudriavzevii IFO 1802]